MEEPMPDPKDPCIVFINQCLAAHQKDRLSQFVDANFHKLSKDDQLIVVRNLAGIYFDNMEEWDARETSKPVPTKAEKKEATDAVLGGLRELTAHKEAEVARKREMVRLLEEEEKRRR